MEISKKDLEKISKIKLGNYNEALLEAYSLGKESTLTEIIELNNKVNKLGESNREFSKVNQKLVQENNVLEDAATASGKLIQGLYAIINRLGHKNSQLKAQAGERLQESFQLDRENDKLREELEEAKKQIQTLSDAGSLQEENRKLKEQLKRLAIIGKQFSDLSNNY